MAALELMISGSRPEKDITSEMSPFGVCTSPKAWADLLPACSFCTTKQGQAGLTTNHIPCEASLALPTSLLEHPILSTCMNTLL